MGSLVTANLSEGFDTDTILIIPGAEAGSTSGRGPGDAALGGRLLTLRRRVIKIRGPGDAALGGRLRSRRNMLTEKRLTISERLKTGLHAKAGTTGSRICPGPGRRESALVDGLR